jgi:hypothetical protein
MQLMHLMVDGTVLVTPIAIAETCGADHHSYSFYFFPWICSVMLALFFQGMLRFAKVTEDPFGAGCGGESYTNECLLNMEKNLYTILALRKQPRREVDLPENPPPVQHEPVWTGEISQDFLRRDFCNDLYPTASVAGPEQEATALQPTLAAPSQAMPNDERMSPSMPDEYGDLRLSDITIEEAKQQDDVEEDDFDYSEGTDDPEELSRPPDAVVSSSSSSSSDLPPPAAKSMQEHLEEIEKELAETELERRTLRDLVKEREKQMLELQAESIPAEEANELIRLMSEWVNPKRPVRVSDVTFFKLAELARKQTTRVKKILALPIAGRSDPYSETHRHITSASLGVQNKNEPDGIKLLKTIRARIEEETKATARLKFQLAEAHAREKGEKLTADGKKLVKPTKANIAALDRQATSGHLPILRTGSRGTAADDESTMLKMRSADSERSARGVRTVAFQS